MEQQKTYLTKEQFIHAMKYVLLREMARVQHGEASVAALDAYLLAGGTYARLPAEVRQAVDELAEAATVNPPPGWDRGVMDWPAWACFCNNYASLNPSMAAQVREDLRAGNATDPMCSGQVGADSFYAGDPNSHDNSVVEWILIAAGAVTAISALVWFGSTKGWFGTRS